MVVDLAEYRRKRAESGTLEEHDFVVLAYWQGMAREKRPVPAVAPMWYWEAKGALCPTPETCHFCGKGDCRHGLDEELDFVR